jgi:hypothetical protein
MWELGLNFTQVQGTSVMTDLVTYKWPLLNCPEQFAHPATDVERQTASQAFDQSRAGKSCDPNNNGDPKVCLTNPVRLATSCVGVVVALSFLHFAAPARAGAAG